jgi:hypothetical protein
MLLSPLLNPLYMDRPFEVVFVLRFLKPFLLACRLAGPPAFRLLTKHLAFSIPMVRNKKPLAILTFYLFNRSHPQCPSKQDGLSMNGNVLLRIFLEEKGRRNFKILSFGRKNTVENYIFKPGRKLHY